MLAIECNFTLLYQVYFCSVAPLVYNISRDELCALFLVQCSPKAYTSLSSAILDAANLINLNLEFILIKFNII